MRRYPLTVFAGLSLLLVSLVGSSAGTATAPPGIIAINPSPAPGLQVIDPDGNAFSLGQARGRWAFVHFWASWCGPCRREMPGIQRLIGRLDGDSWVVVLVNTAEDEDTIFQFLGGVAPELHSYMDRSGLVTEGWQPRGLPATYLVDPEGRIRFQALGGRPWDEKPYLDFLHGLSGDR